MFDVVPSFYQTREVGANDETFDGGAFSNDLLRVGEVKRIIWPEDPRSRSKKFVEYDVYVQHRENGTAVTKMYHACRLQNALGGLADSLFFTLRVDPQVGPGGQDSAKDIAAGLGSKVLILCVNAEHNAAFILGGIQDGRDSDVGKKAQGHQLKFKFNGVVFGVHDDGSWTLENLGKTKADDTPADDADAEGAGTTVKVEANGNFSVVTPNKKQSVTIDHKAGVVTVEAENELVFKGAKIRHGAGADQHAVLGEELVGVLDKICTEVGSITVGTPAGTSGPPNNLPKFVAIKKQLNKILSRFVFVKKDP